MKKIIRICDQCKKPILEMSWEEKGDEDYHVTCYMQKAKEGNLKKGYGRSYGY